MANEILYNYGTAIVWADDAGDYDSSASGLAATHQLSLVGVLDTEAREGAKADLGDTRARQYVVLAAIEWDTAPTSGELVEFYWVASPSGTAGNANPGGATGADADYAGSSGDSLADSVQQLIFIGSMVCTSDSDTEGVQYQQIGVLTDIPQYGFPIVKNESGQTFHSDDVEMYVALIPLVDEVQ